MSDAPDDRAGGALAAVRARRSWSKVTDEAPTREELLPLVAAAGRVADHSSLRPWRLIELRGDDRRALGAAIAETQGDDKPSEKPLRAPLLIAVVATIRPSEKVPDWEQEAVASGVAHVLSLLLDEAGWGVIWRTGHYTRSTPVASIHGLGANERLLGWLYVGGKPARERLGARKTVDPERHLDRMPAGDPDTAAPVPSDAHPEKNGKSDKKARKKARKKAAKAEKKRAKKAAEAAGRD